MTTNVTPMTSVFDKPLAVATATYAYSILTYMQRSPDLNMADVGNVTLTYLQNVRHVKPEYLTLYYEALSGLIRPLIRYASLAESCSKSKAYDKDRLITLDTVRTTVNQFEHPADPKVFEYLNDMLEAR